MQTCKTCKFYLPNDNRQGLCLRFPPVVVIDSMNAGNMISIFPCMLNEGWCGEFKQTEGTE